MEVAFRNNLTEVNEEKVLDAIKLGDAIQVKTSMRDADALVKYHTLLWELEFKRRETRHAMGLWELKRAEEDREKCWIII